MSKILANQIANYGDDSPIELKEGLNIPAGKPLQIGGLNGTAGQVLSTSGTDVSWISVFSGNYNDLTNKPTIPSGQVNADWNATSGVAVILNKPVIPAQPSVTVNAVGTSNLEYNQANGEFTYTPPDLSPYLTSLGDAAGVTAAKISNWDIAYGWGDHSAAGYATETWVNDKGYVTSSGLENVVEDLAPQLGGNLDLNSKFINGSGTIDIDGNIGGNGILSQTNSLTLGNSSSEFIIRFSQNTGTSPQIRNQVGSTNGIQIWGAYNFGGTHEADVLLGTSGQASWFKNLEPRSDSTYYLGTANKKWSSLHVDALHAGGLSYPTSDGNAGQVLASDGTGNIAWTTVAGSGSGIALADLSVSVESAGTANLTYNNVSGVFSYTPPDLSSYLTAETDPVFVSSPSYGILQQNINNWNAAYAWGDHASEGYLTSYAETDTLDSVTGRGATTTNAITVGGLTVSNDGTNTGKFVINDTGSYTQLEWYDSLGNGGPTIQGVSSNLYINAGGHVRVAGQGTIFYGDGNIELNATSPVNSTTTFFNGFTVSGGDLACGSANLTTTGKLYYSNNFATTGDLPNATTYHGMFAHVHAEGHGYFAHAGAWTQLLDTGSSIGDLADVDLSTAPTTGQVLKYDGSNWSAADETGTASGANVTISDTAPGSPDAGDLWWESDKGRLKIYYQDTDSSQWVDASPPLSNDSLSLVSTTTTNGTNAIQTTSSTSGDALEFKTDNGTTSAVRWRITSQGSLIPAANDTYDIGSAEYKVRDFYLSDTSMHTASGKALQFSDGILTWGGQRVLILEDVQSILSTCNTFDQFRAAILNL